MSMRCNMARSWTIALSAIGSFALPAETARGDSLDWMAYLGGAGDEQATQAAVDQDGNILITGSTFSADFEGAVNAPLGGEDAFALKMTPAGEVLWMAYFGGNGSDTGHAIAASGPDEVIVTGWTDSSNFAGRVNSYHGGTTDGFVLKFSPSDGVQWMRYVGGAAQDFGYDMAVDGAGDALLVGHTDSMDFQGAGNSYYGGTFDGFILRVSPSGAQTWMRYLGGDDKDRAYGIAIDASGNALVAGTTESLVFEGQTNSHHGSRTDAYALKMDAAGTIQWMTYLGGSSGEHGRAIAVDPAGNAYVTGNTWSADFEGRNNERFGGGYDSFGVKVSPAGEVLWMTYIGGTDVDGGQGGHGVSVAANGDVLFTGSTGSTDFVGAVNSYHGGLEAYATSTSPAGALQWTRFIGGSARDSGYDVVADQLGRAYFIGATNSDDFEGRANVLHGADDAYILRIGLSEGAPAVLTDFNVNFGTLIAGGLADLEQSDNERLQGRSRFGFASAGSHVFDLQVGAITGVMDPQTMALSLEGRLNVSGTARLRLRNWATNSFELVHEFAMGTMEATETVSGVAAGDRVRLADGRIELSLRQSAVVTFSVNGFDSYTDLVEIRVE